MSCALWIPTGALTAPIVMKVRAAQLPRPLRRACLSTGLAMVNACAAVQGTILLLNMPFATARQIGAALGLSP